jgi:tripartite ATP-independent transporter DctM subunit
MVWGLFVGLLVMILAGVPIIFCIGLTALLGILLIPGLPTVVFTQRMFTILDNFSLLAIPYFILAGELMCKGGISKRLVSFAEACVGHLRGGLGMVSVLSSMIFGGVSGSAVADTSAIGSLLIPAMKERGYKPGYAASLLAASGTIGPTIPPSMNMIIYGSMAGVSIGGMFMAGIIPGVVIGIALMLTVYFQSFLPKYPELREVVSKFSLSNLWNKTRQAWTALIAPLIVLGGIICSVFTATEAGAVAVIYSLFVSFFVYKSIKLKDLPAIFLDTAITTAVVLGILATAGAFSWLLAYLDFNEMVFKLLTSISSNPTVVLLVLMTLILGLTMFVECLAVLILLMPVFVYICSQFGFNPYYFGLLMVMTIQIGAVTPPVGVLLYVATGIAENTFDDTLKYITPFITTLIIVLLLIVICPPLATWIPEVFLK